MNTLGTPSIRPWRKTNHEANISEEVKFMIRTQPNTFVGNCRQGRGRKYDYLPPSLVWNLKSKRRKGTK